MQKYYVNTARLNVRSTPNSIRNDNIAFILDKYRIVDVSGTVLPDWWEVQFMEGSILVSGFVAARYLLPLSEGPKRTQLVNAVHFPRDPSSNLNTKNNPHKPMDVPSIPLRDSSSIDSRIKSVHNLVDVLDVANSLRYQPTAKKTFCNIYACDFCYFSGAYLPRVWWYDDSVIERLINQEDVGVRYGVTVREMNANALHDWLQKWGGDFGWIPMKSGVTDFQNLININGGFGVVCARRRDRKRSGHITVVLPETAEIRSRRVGGDLVSPLQSQAGAQNLKYFSAENEPWWQHSRYDSFGMFFHE
ncbi:MAG: hypothetical protein ACKOA4_07485 [Haliscomenobacter sp.]